MSAMNLLEMILQTQNGGAVQQAGNSLGLNTSQSQSAIAALLPAISSALKQNTSSPQGLAGLLGALQNGKHQQYIENPQILGQPETVTEGNAILGHLFGSKDVSRAVAGRAAQQTGLPVDMLKKMLPLVATMAMGSLSKQTKQPTMQSALAGMAMQHLMGGTQKSGLGAILGVITGGNRRATRQQRQTHQQGLGILGKMLDADGDGSMMDDVLRMAMNKR